MEIINTLRNLPTVAVIGGGVSGLICARKLTEQNYRVKVFDRCRRPGGRLSTLRTCKYSFDHGVQYFTVRDQRFRWHVDSWIANGFVAEWYGEISVVNNGLISDTTESVHRFVGIPSMSAIIQHLANGCDLQTEVTVSQVQKQGKKWLLSNQAGEDLGHYDIVVAATPGPEAARLLSGAPKLAQRAEATKMLGCWALLLAFDSPVELPFDGAFVHNSPLSWIARDSSKAGRDNNECWVLHAQPEWSEEHKDETPEKVTELLLDAFIRATGYKVSPSFSKAYFWRYAVPVTTLEERFLYDPVLAIGACGDWCAGPRVEGAFLSGLEIANLIISLPD